MTTATMLKKMLLSRTLETDYNPDKNRITTINFPGVDGEPYRSIQFRSDDGLILYLLKRIEALEKKTDLLESSKINETHPNKNRRK